MTCTQGMRLRAAWVVALVAVGLAACGGGGDGHDNASPGVTEAVPGTVVTSPEAAAVYVAQLAATAEEVTDALEPVALPTEALATDDEAEPRPVN